MLYDGIEPTSDIIADNKKSFSLGFHDAVEFLVHNGVTPIVFKDIPYIKERLSKNHVKNILFGSKLNTTVSWAEVAKHHEFEDSVIDSIKTEFPSVIVIDPKDLMKNYL